MRTIAHISDLHFGKDDPAVAAGLVADLREQPFDVLVNSGDFTQRARGEQYRAAAEFMGKLPEGRPRVCVPGNHDIPLYDVVRRFFFPLGRYTRYISPDVRPFYRDEHLAIIGINTARPWTWSLRGFWKDGRISTEQVLDVKTRLCELPDEVVKVVVTHHPFIPPPKERVHGIVWGAVPALDIMEGCGVDICLAGHLHMGYSGDVRTHHEGVKRSMISIQAGTAVSTRRRGNEPNAYNLITVNPEHVTIQVRAWNGARFEKAEKTHYSRFEGVWQREG
jgi:3',5'-cyclic AMP phosphodiesterase CpdA